MAASQGDRLPMIAVMMHSPQQNVCIMTMVVSTDKAVTVRALGFI
ncbi:MAG: hypothetical protein OXI08_08505 [Cyanobacteria bacterium MAG IRC4_bin_6]|nr:hypothetical protein [Cyanobacteria bacterium MAG IRC3_bin_20]MDE0648057.1 hypothetical protein [Cyanobacteria bacterium MAG IRC4_bin_6]